MTVGRPGRALVVVKSMHYPKGKCTGCTRSRKVKRVRITHSGKITMQKDLYRKDGNTSARISTYAGMQNDIQGCMRSGKIDLA